MNPLVSIIVPVYNCESYISECLDSILFQTYSNIEVLIINDGSIDDTEKNIMSYLKRDLRIKYFFQENRGPSEARNIGISNSNGKFIVFVDADDTIDSTYVECLFNRMDSLNSDLVCCGYKDISVYGQVEYNDFNFENTNSIHSIMELVCKGTGGVLWGKIYKKEIITKNKLKMNKELFMNEDLVFVLQYVSVCKSFSFLNKHLYNYNRLNQNSITAKSDISYINNFISVCMHIEKIFECVNLERQKQNKIITKKIQDILIKIVEQQSGNIEKGETKEAILNVTHIIEMNYINTRIDNFETHSLLYKPYIVLLKKKYILLALYYGNLVIKLKRIKNKLVRR
ncbi:glycosyl transferase [Virgibacillus phasianinus]|uniref:Glycosyl transferase n=1 Tax=Virgibacillus phasianinus TaxID=2017483 RepID=A0A220U6G6_9BACI|nr:glycosyltransferase family 2 protein [Virgibacillus phasianinus]ASK63717.1 glycosyl transferase [Virgibacillus phasianinus]